jgi:SAM-dependent methyltransferase
MGWWTDQVVPRITDKALNTKEIPPLRDRACDGLSGDVVEVGFGSGLNVAHYPSAVRSVSAVEPSDVAWRMAVPRIEMAGTRVVRAGLDGQKLDLPTSGFDAALSTFTMCTILELDAALREILRVLKPGGILHFVEHGRSPDASVVRWQDRLQPIQFRVAGGCHLNRPIAEHVSNSGLELDDLEAFYEKGPKPFSYIYLGRAVKP